MMTGYFDFEDGNGLVPAHRHPNGKGWVANTAYVDPTVYVGPNARVYQNAEVYDYAIVIRNARVFGYARVFHYAEVFDYAEVYDHAKIIGNARVFSYSRVYGDANVYGIRRSDGYVFVYVPDDKGLMKVQAGCRNFTMKEAKKHWKKTIGGTPLGDETMAILQSIEILSKVKPEGCV